MKIFVQIAAYRDPELIPTIRHCLERAKCPEDLTFGICWQYEDGESIEEFENDTRFKFVKVSYKESKGACWARSRTNELYDNEKFTLQIDSHTRFIQNWDDVITNMWEDLQDNKAVLTSYPPQYEPGQLEEEWKTFPHTCNVYSFKDDQTQQKPSTPSDIQDRLIPYRAVHVAAGFIFGPGSLIRDVPYDPQFYFAGEETALTIRLFTHGYNLYHPHKIIVYHYYERKDQNKHWSDNTEWINYNATANDRLDCLLGRHNNLNMGKYGLGTERSLKDFQNYSGIDYDRKIVHVDTINGKEPPVDLIDKTKWSYEIKTFSETFGWVFEKIDQQEDITFWAFIFKDENEQEIFREDITNKEYPEIISGKVFERKFEFSYHSPSHLPKLFIIWPYSKSKGWLNNKTYRIH